MVRHTLCCVALSVFALVSGAYSVQAQGFVSYRPFGGTLVLNYDPGVALNTIHPTNSKKPGSGYNRPDLPRGVTLNVGKPIADGWSLLSTGINKVLPKVAAREYAKGVSAYDINCKLAGTGKLDAWAVDDRISLRYVVSGNSLAASFTTPDVSVGPVNVGVGKYADPRIELDFDVMFIVGIKFNLHKAPTITQASCQIVNARFRGKNLSGDALNLANSVVSFFGGPDFKSTFEDKLNALGIDASKPVNQLLSGNNVAIAALTKNAQTVKAALKNQRINITYSATAPQKLNIK